MRETRGDRTWRCPGCGTNNDPGMGFCMECGEARRGTTTMPAQGSPGQTSSGFPRQGTGTVPVQQPTRGRICPSCGQFDALSNRFCIYCGSSTQTVTFEQFKSMQEMTVDIQSVTGETARTVPPALPVGLMVAAAVCGVVAGVLIALFAYPSLMENIVVKSSWPPAGLVLYAQPSLAQVMLEENTGRHFTLGQTGTEGELTVTDLAPGTYRLILSAPGHKSVTRDVDIERNKVTVLGYPEKITLPSAG